MNDTNLFWMVETQADFNELQENLCESDEMIGCEIIWAPSQKQQQQQLTYLEATRR